ncbi:MAG: hypothetical protein COA43_14070 [Robiginitomaculum sp.]|nr:MAG: hypothetical protein COA43_14070 [Robiginitomaculum sp.]
MDTPTSHPRKQVLLKFFLLCLLMISYFGYLSYEYDLVTGGVASLLTWSFFVLCTPVADAGFLLDFPLRLLFGIRMVVSEIAVWAIAILLNVVSFSFFPQYYDTTIVTRLLQKIITTPYPYGLIVILSGIGTFLSIRFGDELMDVLHHHDRHFFHKNHFKHELVLIVFFVMVLFGYYELIVSLGIDQQF